MSLADIGLSASLSTQHGHKQSATHADPPLAVSGDGLSPSPGPGLEPCAQEYVHSKGEGR
eukprot:scaffold1876_cov132-Isochrysis_galbana.AAC.5